MRSFVFFAALPLLAAAWNEHMLLPRQSSGNGTICADSDKACGDFCIPSSYTCCPDLEGGCASTDVCQKGDNDVYGCCPKGRTCTGDGDAEYIDSASDASSTSSSTASSSSSTSSNAADSMALNNGMLVAAAAAGFYFGL
ncbi:hypothetical protein B0A52_00807 [Exophiala mesophila]|uniref:Granulins domain-containing protein n=1 Tax=Exophiala mesophila TaxID=212818 RepID=A0A438NI95_EXOME|nr:hypothetical protein B0A52_00807 [Exophiala mesophila]